MTIENPTEKCSEALDGLFKFAIGDLVVVDSMALWVALEAGCAIPDGKMRTTEPCSITERTTVQCHGGVQLFYTLETVRGVRRVPEYQCTPFDVYAEAVKEEWAKREKAHDVRLEEVRNEIRNISKTLEMKMEEDLTNAPESVGKI